MTLLQIQYVLAIAETESMNKAASRLYVSQPTLTSAIKDLEEELGITIFSRSTRGVSLTEDGLEFLGYARQLYQQYDLMEDRYRRSGKSKKRFCVSTQHYTFAVSAFIETMKKYSSTEYESTLRETTTMEIIQDVSSVHSEVGILYFSGYNRKVLEATLKRSDLIFYPLTSTSVFAYMSRNHPLAEQNVLHAEDLQRYPCISYEQGKGESFFFAEEFFPEDLFSRRIRVCDRGTMINLITGLNGYTVGSGLNSDVINGQDIVTIPLRLPEENGPMEIGYIVKKDHQLSDIANDYILAIRSLTEP